MSERVQPEQQSTAMSRRDFTLEAALAVLAGCVITISDACGGNSTSPNNPSPPTVDLTGTISANHNHTAVVTAAQITAANAVVLNIQGTAVHSHTLSLSQ